MPRARTTIDALIAGATAYANNLEGPPWRSEGGLLWDDASEAEYEAYVKGWNAAAIDSRRRALEKLKSGDVVNVHESGTRGLRRKTEGRVLKVMPGGYLGELCHRRALVQLVVRGKRVRRVIRFGALAVVGA